MTANWRTSLARLGIVWAALLALFWRDVADMASIWWNSSTFNHCLLIIPILWWLVDQRKSELTRIDPQPWGLPLIWMAAASFGWLLGDAAGVALARHAGLVMLLQGSVALLLGPAVTRGLLFPLFYMFFLVPFGEEFVPALQTITAEMCMWLLGLTGIPAHIDGIYIATPTALFRVAEACSGVKFLVAMVALGALVSNLCFKSWPRRIAFMAACIIIPIIANGLRAFATIYIAHHGNLDFAASFDHVIFGWVFFGIVIALVLAAGWPFFDRAADAPAIHADQLAKVSGTALKPAIALGAMAAIVLLPFGWSTYIANRASPVPAQIDMPEVAGWARVDYRPLHPWKPHFSKASHTLLGRYRNAQEQEVDLYIAVYDRQSEGRELVGFGQGAAGGASHWSWIEIAIHPPMPVASASDQGPASPRGRELLSGERDYQRLWYRLSSWRRSRQNCSEETSRRWRYWSPQSRKRRENPRPAIDSFRKSIRDVDKLADHMAGLD
jgi:exosortase A